VRQLRALFFTLACVVGAVLVMILPPSPTAVSPAAAPAVAEPAVAEPSEGVPVAAGTTAMGPMMHEVPMEATAVRHVPTAAEPASDDSMDPMIDKAMILLIGWVMLMLLGGAVFAAPHRQPGTTWTERLASK
jgi:hypothetical protein